VEKKLEQPLNYEEAGLIVGLEVHQQLLTHRKMFCNCPAGRYTDGHDGTILRHMRPTLSETGEYDGTALMEFKTKKNIIYLLNRENTCTYEMDDTPPFPINQQSLDVAIEQCLMLGCDIIDEVHITRKQYLDGSIPTGFQRTAIVGVGGALPFRGRELSITQVSVEEDSCREVRDRGHLVVWRTDRLGMPLIETVTGPDLRTPEEVAEAILLIGRVCRSTRHVRLGPGASRQDINVSVRGGRRVEIKGVCSARLAPALVHNEAWRQVNLLRLRDELHRRGFAKAGDLDIPHQDVTDFFTVSEMPLLREEAWASLVRQERHRVGFELGRGPFCVRAVKLSGLAKTLEWPTQPDHDFAYELAGRVRVIAGLDQQPILLHSDKWPDYRISRRELRELKDLLGSGPEDSLVVVWGPEEDTVTAAREIRLRYADAIEGIPHETRQAFSDGSTGFERILPGPDRMYPDTDSPPVRVLPQRVERLRQALPPPPWEREQRYSATGVPRQTIYFLIRYGAAAIVDKVVQESGADLRQACFFFGERVKGLQPTGVSTDAVPERRWVKLFNAFARRPALADAWREVVSGLARAPERALADVVAELGLDREVPPWQAAVAQVLASERPDHCIGDGAATLRYYMGRLMQELRGLVPAPEVAAALDQALNRSGEDQDER